MPGNRIEADYLLETPADPRRVADLMAGEQSSGTFVAIPGETAELKERVAAHVARFEILDETTTPLPTVCGRQHRARNALSARTRDPVMAARYAGTFVAELARYGRGQSVRTEVGDQPALARHPLAA